MGIVLDWNIIIAFGAGLIVLYLLLKVLSAPLRILWKFLWNVIFGVVGLFVFNLIGGIFGFTIPINILTAFIVGFLGVPGVVLLVIMMVILGI